MNTTLQETLVELYNEFKAGVSISELATLHQITNTEMYNLVQMGKRLVNEQK
jgi:Mor family transcriptional regulator